MISSYNTGLWYQGGDDQKMCALGGEKKKTNKINEDMNITDTEKW
jgi:hypothetical protein